MIILEEEFWKYVFVVTIGLFVIVLVVSVYQYQAKSQLCKDKGGALVELPDGYACVKLERVELK
jgi:hypothetical protein